MSSKIQEDIVFRLVQEVREDQKEMHRDLVEHQAVFKEHLKQDERIYEELNEMKITLVEISRTMDRNTQSLVTHIEGVQTLKALHIQNSDRIGKLEEPDKVKKFLKNKILFYTSIIAGLAGAITAIMKFLDR